MQYIEGYVTEYLQNNNSPYRIRLDMEKELKSGDKRMAVHPTVLTPKGESISYHSLSNGERAKINLSFDMAFVSLINNRCSKGLNLYINDELLNPIDEVGIEKIFNGFKERGTCMFLCAHSVGGTKFLNHEVCVRKEAGISSVVT